MFNPQMKPTGREYTPTVALMTVALILIPGLLILSQPFSRPTLFVALLCSVLCIVQARRSWKTSSHLAIPSIVSTPAAR